MRGQERALCYLEEGRPFLVRYRRGWFLFEQEAGREDGTLGKVQDSPLSSVPYNKLVPCSPQSGRAYLINLHKPAGFREETGVGLGGTVILREMEPMCLTMLVNMSLWNCPWC
ncbi:hypothetical protein cypCar_00040102 [Cyprinus carpio]|nr:hypothetical protein cypCar_00040102 [Cyprinus carpio]